MGNERDASPQGVPDSVRALLDRARFHIDGMRDATHPVAKEIDALLSTHPAGQSTGQGADEPCAWAGGNDTCYCRTCGEEYRYGREDKPACPRKPARQPRRRKGLKP